MRNLPDPVDFVARALAARGALVEHDGPTVVAVLPETVARSLALPESVTLATDVPDGGAGVACGVGSVVLERLTTELRAAAPWTVVAPTVEAPRVAHATAMASRMVVRNGLAEVVGATVGTGWYARSTEAWVVEADDRVEGLVHAHTGPDGGEPDALVQDILDVGNHDHPSAGEVPEAVTLRGLLNALPVRVTLAMAAAVEAPVASVAHRHARDHARMGDYFEGLLTELGRSRRKVTDGVMAQRVAATVEERDARQRDLALRYTPRVTSVPALLVVATLPVVRVQLRVRRRKATGEIRVTLPAGAGALDALACHGCGGSTARPALCDDRLHVVCERCVPQVAGRFTCPACIRG